MSFQFLWKAKNDKVFYNIDRDPMDIVKRRGVCVAQCKCSSSCFFLGASGGLHVSTVEKELLHMPLPSYKCFVDDFGKIHNTRRGWDGTVFMMDSAVLMWECVVSVEVFLRFIVKSKLFSGQCHISSLL